MSPFHVVKIILPRCLLALILMATCSIALKLGEYFKTKILTAATQDKYD